MTDRARPSALVVGSKGQDGQILTALLAKRGYRVVGLSRSSTTDSCGKVLHRLDVLDPRAVQGLIEQLRPSEIYYLAAVHGSSEQVSPLESESLWVASYDVHVRGLVNCLTAVAAHSPSTRLSMPGSSHVFGMPRRGRQTDRTPFQPISVYGITKAAGMQVCRMFREQRSVFAAAGILYNHESHLRPLSFVSRKIVVAAVQISRGERQHVDIKDLTSRVDWGYAPDYTDAMSRILALATPDDFVVATGRAYSVREFASLAFEAVGLDWAMHVQSVTGAEGRRDCAPAGWQCFQTSARDQLASNGHICSDGPYAGRNGIGRTYQWVICSYSSRRTMNGTMLRGLFNRFANLASNATSL